MSLLKAIRTQLGLSVTPANNFTLDASADNGTMRLYKGNAGTPISDVMTVDAAGKPTFSQMLLSKSVNGSIELAPGLLLQWGAGTSTGGAGSITYPTAFSLNAYSVVCTIAEGLVNKTISVNASTPSGFTVATYTANTAAGVSSTFTWFAIGPK